MLDSTATIGIQAGVFGFSAKFTGISVFAASTGVVILSLGAVFLIGAIGVALIDGIASSSESQKLLTSK